MTALKLRVRRFIENTRKCLWDLFSDLVESVNNSFKNSAGTSVIVPFRS